MRTTKLPISTISNNPTLTVLTILSAKNSRGLLSSSIRKVRSSKRGLALYQNFKKSQSSSPEFDFLRYRLTISQTTTVIPSFSTAISLSRPSFLPAQVHLTQVFPKCAPKSLNVIKEIFDSPHPSPSTADEGFDSISTMENFELDDICIDSDVDTIFNM